MADLVPPPIRQSVGKHLHMHHAVVDVVESQFVFPARGLEFEEPLEALGEGQDGAGVALLLLHGGHHGELPGIGEDGGGASAGGLRQFHIAVFS